MESLKTHFIFERKVEIPPTKEDTEKGILAADGYTKVIKDSFDVRRIIRTITKDDGNMIVLLDDLHERWEDRPKVHPKTNQPRFDKKGKMMFERVKDTFQSEIHISEKEGKKLLKLITI